MAGSSCSPTPATSRSSGTRRRSPSTTRRRTPSTARTFPPQTRPAPPTRTRRRRSPKSTRFLTDLGVHWALSECSADRRRRSARLQRLCSPKHDGGLLGSLQLAWDASQGHAAARRRLRAGRQHAGARAGGDRHLATAPSPSGDVNVAPPAGAKVVDLGGGNPDTGSSTPAVTGLAAVQAAAPFTVVAPDSLVGLPRKDVRLVGGDTVLALYGQGLGGIALVERKVDSATTGRTACSRTCRPSRSTASRRMSSRPNSVLCSSGSRAARASCSRARSRPAAAETAARAVK